MNKFISAGCVSAFHMSSFICRYSFMCTRCFMQTQHALHTTRACEDRFTHKVPTQFNRCESPFPFWLALHGILKYMSYSSFSLFFPLDRFVDMLLQYDRPAQTRRHTHTRACLYKIRLGSVVECSVGKNAFRFARTATIIEIQ